MILYDPNPLGGGGGAPPANAAFLNTLPEDIRGESVFKDIPDVPTLGKNYLNAQRMIGTKRLPIPEKSWTDAQWNEFYSQTGRPDLPEKYEVPDIKMEPGLALDGDKLTKVKGHFHKLGLSTQQARGVMEYYMNVMNEGARGQSSASAQEVATAQAELKTEWGDKYDANVDLAKAVVRKFGDEKFMAYIDSTGMGNNSQLIRMLAKVGTMITEDTAKGGGADFNINNSTRAIQEIATLTIDKDFQASLNKPSDPGHKASVERWLRLHQVAYPGKQSE